MEIKKNIYFDIFMFVFPIFICFLLNFYYAGIFIPIPYRSLAPFYGKVIDADTKEPIEGAVVLAVYHLTRYTLAGESDFIVDGQEALTDKNGEFKLLRKRRWFVYRRGCPEGELEIFKPGYGTLFHERSNALGENKSWPTPNKYIVYEIPKLAKKEQRLSNLPGPFLFNEIAYDNQKMFIKAINEESKNLGISQYEIPDKENSQ